MAYSHIVGIVRFDRCVRLRASSARGWGKGSPVYSRRWVGVRFRGGSVLRLGRWTWYVYGSSGQDLNCWTWLGYVCMSVCLYMNGRLGWRCPGCFAEMR